jgi:hypothetical protein
MQGVRSVTPGAQSVGVNIGRETGTFGEPWSGGLSWPFVGGVPCGPSLPSDNLASLKSLI